MILVELSHSLLLTIWTDLYILCYEDSRPLYQGMRLSTNPTSGRNLSLGIWALSTLINLWIHCLIRFFRSALQLAVFIVIWSVSKSSSICFSIIWSPVEAFQIWLRNRRSSKPTYSPKEVGGFLHQTRLCDRCQGSFFATGPYQECRHKIIYKDPDYHQHHPSYESLLRSVHAGCKVCAIIHNRWISKEPSMSPEHQSQVGLCCTTNSTGKTHAIRFRLYNSVTPYFPADADLVQLDKLDCKIPTTNSIYNIWM